MGHKKTSNIYKCAYHGMKKRQLTFTSHESRISIIQSNIKKTLFIFFSSIFFIQSLYNLIEDLLRLVQPSEQVLISAFTL